MNVNVDSAVLFQLPAAGGGGGLAPSNSDVVPSFEALLTGRALLDAPALAKAANSGSASDTLQQVLAPAALSFDEAPLFGQTFLAGEHSLVPLDDSQPVQEQRPFRRAAPSNDVVVPVQNSIDPPTRAIAVGAPSSSITADVSLADTKTPTAILSPTKQREGAASVPISAPPTVVFGAGFPRVSDRLAVNEPLAMTNDSSVSEERLGPALEISARGMAAGLPQARHSIEPASLSVPAGRGTDLRANFAKADTARFTSMSSCKQEPVPDGARTKANDVRARFVHQLGPLNLILREEGAALLITARVAASAIGGEDELDRRLREAASQEGFAAVSLKLNGRVRPSPEAN